jgi:hypothetical protein
MKILFAVLFLYASILACSTGRTDNPPNFSALQTTDTGKNVIEIISGDTNESTKPNSAIPLIKPSNIIAALRKEKNNNPNMKAKQLAEFGNEFIKKFGYDYTFDWLPKGKENNRNFEKINYDKYYPFYYQFTDTTEKTRKYQLMNNGFAHPCFSVIDIPVTKVTDKIVRIISDGKEVEIFRPKDFYTEEFVLLDKSLKNPIRKWKTPIDATPAGISEDGKKVYFTSWEFDQDETNNYKIDEISLAVEISEDGELKLVDINEIKSDKGVEFDYEKESSEIIYIRYRVGNNEYNLKYTAPCT